MTYRRPLPPPSMEEIEEKYKNDLAHIYDLIKNICTFQKVRFNEYDSAWTQGSKGYYKLQIPCEKFVPLAAFERNDGAEDTRANCIIDSNSKFATITSTTPFDGYLVVANVNFDDDDALTTGENIVVDTQLNTFSNNPVANKVITEKINALANSIGEIPEGITEAKVRELLEEYTNRHYAWSEICGIPQLVNSISYNDEEFPNYNGVVVLDKLDDYLQVPRKASDLILDISVDDLEGGEGFDGTIASINASIASLSDEIDEHKESIEDKFEAVTDALEDVANAADTKARNAYDSAKAYTDNAMVEVSRVMNTNNQSVSKQFSDVYVAIANTKAELTNADTKNASDISNLAHECRQNHDTLNGIIATNTARITALENTSSVPTNTTQLVGRLNVLDEEVATLETKVANNKVALENSISETNDRIDAQNTVISGVSAKIAQTDSDISDLADVVNGVESTVNSNASALANLKSGYAEDSNRTYTTIGSISDAIDALNKASNTQVEVSQNVAQKVDDIPNLIKKYASNGVLVEPSDRNGYIVVKKPMTTTDGSIAYDNDGKVVYVEEEFQVYEHVIPDEVVTEDEFGQAIESLRESGTAYASINLSKEVGTPKTVNISDSSGIVFINGTNITVQNKAIEGHIEELNTALTEQQTIIQNQNTIINNLQNTITTLNATINNMQTNIYNLQNWVGDDNGILEPEKGERPLSEKQNKEDAVTDSDAMDANDVVDAFNGIE